MKLIKAATFAACMLLAAGHCLAEELKLFGAPLRDIGEPELLKLAREQGATGVSKQDGVQVFDASKMGIPGIKTLTILYAENRFVLARYSSRGKKESGGFDGKMAVADQEKLRKLLAARYGLPQSSTALMGSNRAEFTGQYASDGERDWKFDGDMQLKYKQEFFGAVELTYFNSKMVQRTRSASEAANNAQIKAQQQDLGGKL